MTWPWKLLMAVGLILNTAFVVQTGDHGPLVFSAICATIFLLIDALLDWEASQ